MCCVVCKQHATTNVNNTASLPTRLAFVFVLLLVFVRVYSYYFLCGM